MRTFVLGALASTTLGCSDGASHHVPPETAIDDKPAALTSQAHVRITFHAGGIANRFICQLDGGAPTTCISPFEADVTDGDHTFAVAAALNTTVDDTPATTTWTVDTVAPDTAIVMAPPALDNALAPEVTFEGSDNRGAVMFECGLDDAAFAACASPAIVAVTDGNHTYRVRAVDAAGNRDPSPATASWTVDSSAPETLLSAGPAAGSFTGADVTFGFGSPDSPVTFECALEGAVFAACTSPASFRLADGSHTFTVRARDTAGAVDPSPAIRTWTVDTTPPVVTVTAVATPTNNRTPSVSFTVTGGATQIQCRVDVSSFADCASPFTAAALADGPHTVTVRATDAAGNPGTGATTFTVDGTAPGLAFDDTPPAQWPVNYFDMRFHTNDPSATLTCSLDGAAFTACASPLTITTTYNAASTFSVRARDAAGNTTTISTSWTSTSGLVLHYPWEQGQTHNTSLLAQNSAYSPDGTATLPVVGGWAGTAAGSPGVHTYKRTIRALSSSPGGAYTASIWVRVASGADGIVLSTLTPSNGFELAVGGRQASLRVNDGGRAFTVNAGIPPNEWVQLGVLTTGPGAGLQLLVNGLTVATAQAPTMTGFGPGQSADLTVGSVVGVDLDDLRFYNRALQGNERCATLLRGQLDAAGACVPLVPGFELDFENNQVRDTGRWHLGFIPPNPLLISFVTTKLGNGLKLGSSDEPFGFTSGFAGQINQAPGHSFSFWFVAGAPSQERMIDFLHACAAGAPLSCGIRVTYSAADGLTVTAGPNTATTISKSLPVGGGTHSVLVTEQKVGATATTQSLTIYVDGVATVMPIGTGNVYANPSDAVLVPHLAGTTIDEYEFWPRDLSLDPEMLCENGWDGEWNPATATCLLTSNDQ